MLKLWKCPFFISLLPFFSRLSLRARCFQHKSFSRCTENYFYILMLLKHFFTVLIALRCRHRFSSLRKIVLCFNDVAPHNDKDDFFHNLLQFEFFFSLSHTDAFLSFSQTMMSSDFQMRRS